MKTAPPFRNRQSASSHSRPAPPPARGTARDGTKAPAARPGGPVKAARSAGTRPVTDDPESAPGRHLAEAAHSDSATPASARASFPRSFVYAWAGIVYTVRTQRNMRIHISLAVLAIAAGIWLRIAPIEFAMIFVAITGVVISEMINTVAEACVDLATQEYHPLAKVAKDVAAGAVLLSAMLAVVIACFVYIPSLWPLLMRLFGR